MTEISDEREFVVNSEALARPATRFDVAIVASGIGVALSCLRAAVARLPSTSDGTLEALTDLDKALAELSVQLREMNDDPS